MTQFAGHSYYSLVFTGKFEPEQDIKIVELYTAVPVHLVSKTVSYKYLLFLALVLDKAMASKD